MIIWINGPFGAGKTTLTEKLKDNISNSLLFDPEHVGFLIHRFVPESRDTDFQNYPMWRRLVISYILELNAEFKKDIIIPMTLVEPSFINEIFNAIESSGPKIYHFFLELDETILRERIQQQIMSKDEKEDNEIRNWRLQQVDRCLAAKSLMPKETIFLDSGLFSPDQLLEKITQTLL
jgi:predicted ABC-type ATPase